MDMDSSDELALQLLTCNTQEEWQRRVEARDNATRLAAKLEGKRELLAELQVSAERKMVALNEVRPISFGGCLSLAMIEARAKYKPQPQPKGEP